MSVSPYDLPGDKYYYFLIMFIKTHVQRGWDLPKCSTCSNDFFLVHVLLLALLDYGKMKAEIITAFLLDDILEFLIFVLPNIYHY